MRSNPRAKNLLFFCVVVAFVAIVAISMIVNVPSGIIGGGIVKSDRYYSVVNVDVPGTLIRLFVNPGDFVAKGGLIAELQNSELENEIRTTNLEMAILKQSQQRNFSQIEGLNEIVAMKKREAELLRAKITKDKKLLELKAIKEDGVFDLTLREAAVSGQLAELDVRLLDELNKTKQLALEYSKLNDEYNTLLARQKKLKIRADEDGQVLEVSTRGTSEILGKGDDIALLARQAANLFVEMQLAPQDRDRIVVGSGAKLTFINLGAYTTFSLDSFVVSVGEDVITDGERSYYRMILDFPEKQLPEDISVTAGMQVMVNVKGIDRSLAEYLVGPLKSRLTRAFSEF